MCVYIYKSTHNEVISHPHSDALNEKEGSEKCVKIHSCESLGIVKEGDDC